jgi:uncharacterized protein YegL
MLFVTLKATTGIQKWGIFPLSDYLLEDMMNENLTEIVFLLDRSGSMGGLENDTIGGFNGFVNKQAELGETKLTTVLFDDRYELLYDGIDAKDAHITDKEYFTRGSTALLDAIGKTIDDVGKRLDTTPENERPGKVIFVITTDGLENASAEYTYDMVQERIKHQSETYKWEFIFMGANIDVAKESGRLGIRADRAFAFNATRRGMAAMYSLALRETSDLRGVSQPKKRDKKKEKD